MSTASTTPRPAAAVMDFMDVDLSFSGAQREGTLYSTAFEDNLNDLNNIGALQAHSESVWSTAAA
jgi:hypothetical protein